jgi:hydrogenase maturation factor
MALTTDPFFVVPEYGWERAAWFAVHIVASDAATSGLRPAYCAVDLNLPLEMSDDDLAAMWRAVDRACNEIGMAIVTGHTGRYEGCTYPMLGAATVMSVGPADQYLTAAMAAPGDAILMTKGAAIETTALFGVTFPDHLTRALGREVAQAAEALFYRMTVVEDALVAVEVGVRERGVTTLHDATERGVWGGLCDIADASGVGLLVDQDAILIRPETQAICDHFQIDPLAASSEGTLLLTCRQQVVSNLLDRLTDAGLDPRHIGEVTPKDRSVHVVRSGRERELERPEQDPFWPAYSKAWQEWRA